MKQRQRDQAGRKRKLMEGGDDVSQPLATFWVQKARRQLAGVMGQWEETSQRACGPLPPPIKAPPLSQVSLVPEEVGRARVTTPIINQSISNSGLGACNCKAQRFGPIAQTSNLILGGALHSPTSTCCLALLAI